MLSKSHNEQTFWNLESVVKSFSEWNFEKELKDLQKILEKRCNEIRESELEKLYVEIKVRIFTFLFSLKRENRIKNIFIFSGGQTYFLYKLKIEQPRCSIGKSDSKNWIDRCLENLETNSRKFWNGKESKFADSCW